MSGQADQIRKMMNNIFDTGFLDGSISKGTPLVMSADDETYFMSDPSMAAVIASLRASGAIVRPAVIGPSTPRRGRDARARKRLALIRLGVTYGLLDWNNDFGPHRLSALTLDGLAAKAWSRTVGHKIGQLHIEAATAIDKWRNR